MSKKEMDTRRVVEQSKKLPAETQERIGYMIQGALLVTKSRATTNTGTPERPSA